MLRLPSGVHLDGDAEKVYLAFDDEEAGDDGVYAADLAEATGLSEDAVRAVLDDLVRQEVLLRSERVDETYGARYRHARGS